MRLALISLVAGALVSMFSVQLLATTPEDGGVSFNRDVRPILAEHCFACHGPDEKNRQGDLRLDQPDESHLTAIHAENLADSELLQRIDSSDDDRIMPPRSANNQKPLSDAQRQVLRQWVMAGARYQGHWAFEPIDPQAPPRDDLAGDPVGAHPIDRFLLGKLIPLGLQFSRPLNRAELIRRASFDLIGLPPSWEDVVAFENDPSPHAYAKLIDRLLGSPRYGERWGRHWLDLARYADTHGGAAIGFRSFPFSYVYRDYVIRAFNENTPYNQFVIEQIAADQLDLEPNSPQLAALGFLTVGMQFRNRHDTIDDQIDVVARGLMGLTVACARCHDHKFDPISTKDYYSLYAILAASMEPADLPTVAPVVDVEARRQYDQRLRDLQIQLDDFVRDQNEIMRSRLRMQVGLYLREIAKGVLEQDVSTAFLSYRTDDLRPLILNRWLDYLASMGSDDPVFGPWVQLKQSNAPSGDPFRTHARELLIRLTADLAQSGWAADKQHKLGGDPPRWNPLVLETLQAKNPASMLDVADAYGELFAKVHQEWLTNSQQASLEGVSENAVVADDGPQHEVINSPVHRQLRRHLYDESSPTAVIDDVARTLTNRTIEDMIGAKREAIHQWHLTAAGAPPRAMVLKELSPAPAYYVLERGNPLARGAAVEPAFLSAIPVNLEKPLPGKRRLALARAVTSPHNPLTPRVIVNWVWQHHFGQGLVNTPDDFGTRGVAPRHPELLDYLADRFVREGWSIKDLHRTIMLSQAYQQGSVEDEVSRAADPENSLFWRMPRRRLDFESMRDAMLFVSGELDLQIGGRPFDLTAQPTVPRRSVYGFVNRDVVSPLMSTFDAANPNACTVKRTETAVPQQTLFALNSEFIQDRASKIQAWITELKIDDPTERVVSLYRRTLSRNPTSSEVARVLDYVEVGIADETRGGSAASSFDPHVAAARWGQLAHALLASNEFNFLD